MEEAKEVRMNYCQTIRLSLNQWESCDAEMLLVTAVEHSVS